ncbi:phage tail protein [Pseudoalteromonas piscicida]|uniref:phage tail protein n=1 Tax=Pseudoalteromonas piscicida TaxID=43662 RepID=UPI0030AC46F2
MTLLPPNHTLLQRRLQQSVAVSDDIHSGISRLSGFKADPRDNLLMWLVWEYGLEAILPYSQDLRETIKEGLVWQRLRGTPKSLDIALNWLNFDEAELEVDKPGRHFYRYQLASGKIPGNKALKDIHQLLGLSAPVRAKLSRIYHGYDVRELKLSQSGFGALLSDVSGVPFYDGDNTLCKVSFGRSHQQGVSHNMTNASVHLSRTHSQRSHYLTTKRLSEYKLSDKEPSQLPVSSARIRLLSQHRVWSTRTWVGRWAQSWSGTTLTNSMPLVAHVLHRHSNNQ